MTTIEQIKSALQAHIAEAEAATSGPWVSDGYDVRKPGGRMVAYCGPHHTPEHEYPKSCKLQDEANAVFIAHARTMSPAACKCLLLAIEELEGIHESTPLGEYAAWDALESIRQEWHNLTTK